MVFFRKILPTNTLLFIPEHITLAIFTSAGEHESYLVKNWDTNTLITHLKEQNLKLDDDDFDILRKQKVMGQDFLDRTEERLLAPPYNFLVGRL